MPDGPQTGLQTSANGTGGKKKPRGKGFTGANDPRNRQNIAAAMPEVPEPAGDVDDGAPELLKAVRWAFRNIGSACPGTPQQEHYRRLHKKQPVKFAELYAKLEREFQQSKPADQPGDEEPERDEGLERAEGAALRFLKAWEASDAEEEKQKNLEFARRPDAAQIGATLQRQLKCAVERQERLEKQVEDLRAKVVALGGDPHMHINSPELRKPARKS
jgi:hypothetical protein